MSESARSTTEVLVVGAGPVGLMTAGELSRRGVAVRVVEIMDLAGLADEFVERGYPASGLNLLPQKQTEQILAERAASLGVRVGIEQFADDVVATVRAAGQDMNMGLQDAANLSWKLAMVLREPGHTLLVYATADRIAADRSPAMGAC